VTLDVAPGEVVALIGPNGVGKSTLIRAVSGVIPLASGTARVGGEDLRGLPADRRAKLVAVVPQAVHLPDAFTVEEAIRMGRTAYTGWFGRETTADREIAIRAMARAGVAELATRRLDELSGGEQQRVLVARALAQAPRVMLLDEPTAHLDLRHQAGVMRLVGELARDEGLAVLVALHDLNLAARHADRVVLLSSGSIAALGPAAEVLTTDRLSSVYGLAISVLEHPESGATWIMPRHEPAGGPKAGIPSPTPSPTGPDTP
jgi:iron complex transport system ATP-binding protein